MSGAGIRSNPNILNFGPVFEWQIVLAVTIGQNNLDFERFLGSNDQHLNVLEFIRAEKNESGIPMYRKVMHLEFICTEFRSH
jgi:hypothetical protein